MFQSQGESYCSVLQTGKCLYYSVLGRITNNKIREITYSEKYCFHLRMSCNIRYRNTIEFGRIHFNLCIDTRTLIKATSQQ